MRVVRELLSNLNGIFFRKKRELPVELIEINDFVFNPDIITNRRDDIANLKKDIRAIKNDAVKAFDEYKLLNLSGEAR